MRRQSCKATAQRARRCVPIEKVPALYQVLELAADLEPAFGIRSLLRAPRSLALPGSVLEGFISVAQKAGLFVDSFHQVGPGGAALTFLKFSIRGHVMAPGGSWPTPMPSPISGESEAEMAG